MCCLYFQRDTIGPEEKVYILQLGYVILLAIDRAPQLNDATNDAH